jgi:hypothetical protein
VWREPIVALVPAAENAGRHARPVTLRTAHARAGARIDAMKAHRLGSSTPLWPRLKGSRETP